MVPIQLKEFSAHTKKMHLISVLRLR